MSLLWAGGEDIDFPNGATFGVISTTAGTFRSGFARCSLGYNDNPGVLAKSTQISVGGITNGWLSFQAYISISTSSSGFIGLGDISTGNWVGLGATSTSIPTIVSVVAPSVVTVLATGNAYGVLPGGSNRFDIQYINYGTSGTINVYINGAFAVSYTGNISLPSVASLDCICIQTTQRFSEFLASELIVSDVDTRGIIGLCTCAPNGNGLTQNWSNPAYTNFNPITINDTNSTYVNTTGKDEQATIINTPAGNYQIDSVKIAARALTTAGALTSNIALGFNNTNNSTVAVGTNKPLITAFQTVEQYFSTDPTTGTGFPVNFTGYQLDMRSA